MSSVLSLNLSMFAVAQALTSLILTSFIRTFYDVINDVFIYD